MTLIADTGGIFALYDADDRLHAAVTQILTKTDEPIVVPLPVVSEVDYFLGKYLGSAAALDFLESLASGAFELDHLQSEDILRCKELVAKYRDLDLGFVDASVITVAERRRTCQILTIDERDFRAVGGHEHGHFVLLPSDVS